MYTAVHSLCTDTSAGYPPQFPFRLNIVTLIACIREKNYFPLANTGARQWLCPLFMVESVVNYGPKIQYELRGSRLFLIVCLVTK